MVRLFGPGCVAAREVVTTVLAEVALPGAIRSQRSALCRHPALLDACFQSVLISSGPEGDCRWSDAARGRAWKLRSYHSTRSALLPRPGHVIVASRRRCETDLDVFDQAGTVLTVEDYGWPQGFRTDARTEIRRAVTISGRQGELPEVPQIDAGSWLLLSASKLIR